MNFLKKRKPDEKKPFNHARKRKEGVSKEVIVYQMGKVASTSLVRTLNGVETIGAYQSHFLGMEILQKMVELLARPAQEEHFTRHGEGQLLTNLHLTRLLNGYKSGREGEKKIYILTLARHPIDWFISQLIQEMDGYVAGFKLLAKERTGQDLDEKEAVEEGVEALKSELSRMLEFFLSRGECLGSQNLLKALWSEVREGYERDVPHLSPILMSHLSAFCRPYSWFDEHILSNFDIDVLNADYSKCQHHHFEGSYFKLLVLKYEALGLAPQILSEWLGESIDRLYKENLSSGKLYQESVQRIFKGFVEDPQIIRMVSSSKYARAFGYV